MVNTYKPCLSNYMICARSEMYLAYMRFSWLTKSYKKFDNKHTWHSNLLNVKSHIFHKKKNNQYKMYCNILKHRLNDFISQQVFRLHRFYVPTYDTETNWKQQQTVNQWFLWIIALYSNNEFTRHHFTLKIPGTCTIHRQNKNI